MGIGICVYIYMHKYLDDNLTERLFSKIIIGRFILLKSGAFDKDYCADEILSWGTGLKANPKGVSYSF